MNRKTPRLLACALAFVLCAAPVFAGPLATDGTSIWHSSTAFSVGSLKGYVDYAVYTAGNAPAGLAGLGGWSPTPGEYLYTYQVYVTGTAPLSELTIFMDNPADNIGEFTASGVAGGGTSSMTLFSSAFADWTFSLVPQGSQTNGVAFSSPYYPTNGVGQVIDDGTSALVIPLPVPSDQLIPEPSTLVLTSFGLALLGVQWLRRRSRRGA